MRPEDGGEADRDQDPEEDVQQSKQIVAKEDLEQDGKLLCGGEVVVPDISAGLLLDGHSGGPGPAPERSGLAAVQRKHQDQDKDAGLPSEDLHEC